MRRLLLSLAVLCRLLAPPSRAEDKLFVFTAIPDQDPTRLTQRFAAVAFYLHEKLDVTVRYVPAKDYPAAVTAFANDEVQMAWFGGFTGVQARARVPGAQGAEDKQFKTYFIANAARSLDKAAHSGGRAAAVCVEETKAFTASNGLIDQFRQLAT